MARGLAYACLVSLTSSAYSWNSPTAIDVNTTTAIRFDTIVSAAAGAGTTRGVVWACDGYTTDNLNGLFYSRSNDSGATWSPRVDLINTISLPLGSWGENPVIATDASNTWLVSWDACKVLGKTIQADRDIYFMRSIDGGLNWSTSGTVNSNASDVNARNYDVTLATDKAGTWCAAWVSDDYATSVSSPYPRIALSRSADNAQTWSPIQLIDMATTSSYFRNPHIATNGIGTWVLAWDSTTTTDTDVRYCVSTDNGNNWSAANWLNTSASSDNTVFGNYDGDVRLAANPAGTWVAVWTSSYDASSTAPVNDRIVYSRSQNSGSTWSAPALVDPTVLGNAPVEQTPDIVWSGSDFALVWSGMAGLEASYTSNGATWTTPAAFPASPSFAGGPESRPRLAVGTGGLRLGAWVRHPAGATGPDIIAAQDATGSNAVDWNLFW